MPSLRAFDIDKIDGEQLRATGDTLRAAGFNERTVRKRLGLSRLSDLRLESYPYYIHDRLARREPLDLAILIFMLQGIVAVEELEALLGVNDRRLLKSLGILLGQKSTRTYRSAFSFYPQRERIMVTDHRFQHQPWIKARRPMDPVMSLDDHSYDLIRAMIRRPVRSALDLCSGAGVHAIFAAEFADRVIGVDTNPRAINLARLNAMLNDTWNTTFVEGDLYAPVRGDRFDYIVAYPPFAPSPGYELRYRDGGPSGADVLRRIIAGLPDHLSSGGYAQVITHIGEREGEPYADRVRRWLGGANMNIHALKFEERNVDEYAVDRVSEPFSSDFTAYAGNLKRWIDNLRAQRFKRIVSVVFTFEWNDTRASAPWTTEDEVKPPRRAIGDDILQVFQARALTRRRNALAELDNFVAGVPDDIVLSERRRPTGTGFQTKGFRVTWRDPALSPELEIKPLVRELLELVDNRRRVPQIIEAYAKRQGLPIHAIDKKARQAFLAMLERGLITLDRVPESAAIPRSSISDSALLDPDQLPDLDEVMPFERPRTPIAEDDGQGSGAIPIRPPQKPLGADTDAMPVPAAQVGAPLGGPPLGMNSGDLFPVPNRSHSGLVDPFTGDPFGPLGDPLQSPSSGVLGGAAAPALIPRSPSPTAGKAVSGSSGLAPATDSRPAPKSALSPSSASSAQRAPAESPATGSPLGAIAALAAAAQEQADEIGTRNRNADLDQTFPDLKQQPRRRRTPPM